MAAAATAAAAVAPTGCFEGVGTTPHMCEGDVSWLATECSLSATETATAASSLTYH
jgi:hypothetical protein